MVDNKRITPLFNVYRDEIKTRSPNSPLQTTSGRRAYTVKAID